MSHHVAVFLLCFLLCGCIAIGVIDNDNIDTCGGKKYTSLDQLCDDGIFKVSCGSSYYDPSVQYCDRNGNVKDKGEFNETEEFIDERDGRVYKYVTIGDQTWMAENLQFETDAFNVKCYDGLQANCEIFGKMYDWETAMAICPSDWHLPSDSEWDELMIFAGSNAATKLKANSELWIYDNGTDDFGFNALPGGYYKNESFGFISKGLNSAFWSSSRGNMSGSAHFRFFWDSSTILHLDGLYIDEGWNYVRCVKD